MSTLLSDLEGSGGPGGGADGDLVQKILMEMGNGGSAPPPQAQNTSYAPPQMAPPPPAGYGGGSGSVINSPNSQMAPPHVMDSMPPTAHMIGGSHPTAADFAAAMGGGPTAAGAGWGADVMAGSGGQQQPRYVLAAPPKKGLVTRLMDEFRTPMLIAILVFAFSLPVVNFLFAHYLPSMVKSTGELTTVGLLIKSVGAGAAFWVLNTVVVPLLRV